MTQQHPPEAPSPPQIEGDLFAVYAQLRRDTPVFHEPSADVWVVSRHADVVTVMRDHERFSSVHHGIFHAVPAEVAEQLPDGYAIEIPALINQDPPAHTRIRKLAQKALTPGAVRTHEGTVRAIAGELIDAVADAGRADLIEALALPLPTRVLSAILGIPDEDRQQFEHWGRGVVELMLPTISEERRLELAREQVEFSAYVNRVIDKRRAAPGTDLISGLILASDGGEPALSDREIVGIVTQLITAGVDSTTASIGVTLMLLCAHPEALDAVRADPARIPAVIEEAIRRMAPARGVLRETTGEVELGGQTIPGGARVFALVASANHDEAAFSCPAEFSIDRDRKELRHHVGFGIGTHFCIGAMLARLEIATALELVLERLANVRIVPDQTYEWNPSLIFQGPLHLLVEWDAVA